MARKRHAWPFSGASATSCGSIYATLHVPRQALRGYSFGVFRSSLAVEHPLLTFGASYGRSARRVRYRKRAGLPPIRPIFQFTLPRYGDLGSVPRRAGRQALAVIIVGQFSVLVLLNDPSFQTDRPDKPVTLA